MSSYELTDLTLNDFAWDDFLCSVEIRVTYVRQGWYPHQHDRSIEGGALAVAEIVVLAAVLLDCQSTTYQASPNQCAAIQRQLRLECESRRRVQRELERAVS